MSNSLIVFTLKGCYHCKNLKEELKINNFSYTEIEISNNPKIWNQVVEQTGHNVLPTVFINVEGKDNGPVFIPDRDFTSIDELLVKIKKYF